MKIRIALLCIAVAVVGFTLAAPGYAPARSVTRSSAEGASAYWDGMSTAGSVWASISVQRMTYTDSSGYWDSSGYVGKGRPLTITEHYAYADYTEDTLDGFTRLYAHAAPAVFTLETRSLSSASVDIDMSGYMTVWNWGRLPKAGPVVVHVSCDWTGYGSLATSRNASQWRTREYSFMDLNRTTSRPADAVGSITVDGVVLAEGLTSGELFRGATTSQYRFK